MYLDLVVFIIKSGSCRTKKRVLVRIWTTVIKVPFASWPTSHHPLTIGLNQYCGAGAGGAEII